MYPQPLLGAYFCFLGTLNFILFFNSEPPQAVPRKRVARSYSPARSEYNRVVKYLSTNTLGVCR